MNIFKSSLHAEMAHNLLIGPPFLPLHFILRSKKSKALLLFPQLLYKYTPFPHTLLMHKCYISNDGIVGGEDGYGFFLVGVVDGLYE